MQYLAIYFAILPILVYIYIYINRHSHVTGCFPIYQFTVGHFMFVGHYIMPHNIINWKGFYGAS